MDAAVELFTPICVYNNTEGDKDAAVRVSFKEPSWNNPVVRIIDDGKNAIVPRIHDDWSLHKLASSMMTALAKTQTPVPEYLKILSEATVPEDRIDIAIFGMA